MKHLLYSTLFCMLTLVLMASCGGYATHYNVPVMEEGTFRARKLLSPDDQREYDQLYLEGICQKEKGNLDAAHELFGRALEIFPNASEALYEQGLLQSSLSPKSDSALVAKGDEMLLKAAQLEPSNSYFSHTLAQLWVRRGKYARAARLYEQIVANKPKMEDLSMLLQLYEMLGEYEHAFQTVLQIETIEGADEATVMEKFRLNYEMGKTAEAYGTIERFSEEHPKELRYRVLLGDLYMQNGYKEKALGIYNDVLTTDPGNPLVKMAMLQYYIGEHDTVAFNRNMTEVMLDANIESSQKSALLEAYARSLLNGATGISKETLFSHFCEALTIPQNDSSLGELCAAFIDAAKLPADSVHIPLEAILRDDPGHLQARLQMLSYYARQENYAALADLCREGQDYHPDLLLFYFYEGMARYSCDDIIGSIDAYERGATIINDESDATMASDLYAALGDHYHSVGLKEDAYAAYDSSLAFNPDNISCLNNYAYFLSLDNIHLDKAAEMSKKTIEAEPQNATYLDTYAWVLFCKKQYTQARIYIEQTFKCLSDEELSSPSTANLFDHAGDIHFRCGDRKAALANWNEALRLSDDAELTKKLTKKIKNKKL